MLFRNLTSLLARMNGSRDRYRTSHLLSRRNRRGSVQAVVATEALEDRVLLAGVVPTLDPIADVHVLSNAPVSVGLTGISAGFGETQPISVKVLPSGSPIIDHIDVNYTSPDTTGTLQIVFAGDVGGVADVTVVVEDGGLDGQLATTGDNAIFTRRFQVTYGDVQTLDTATGVVGAMFDLSNAGQSEVIGTNGVLPLGFDLPAGTDRWIELPSVTGTWSAGPGWPTHGPEGGTSGPNSTIGTNIYARNGISGIYAFRFMFLSGVFLDDNTPVDGANPPRVDFAVLGKDFETFSPLLQQSFFIGDGHVATGGVQRFHVPDTATRLYLGVLDAASFGWPQGGLPTGAYADNTGTLDVELVVKSVTVNAPPTLDEIADVTYSVSPTGHSVSLTGITDGGIGEGQPLRVTAQSSDLNLVGTPVVTYTSPNSVGSLLLTPTGNALGTATITVLVEDGGLDGDLNTVLDNGVKSQTFQVTIENTAPVFDPVLDVSLDEDSEPFTVNITGVSAGGTEVQHLRFSTSSSNPALLPAPAIIYTSPESTGQIVLSPVANQSGVATVSLTVEDAGPDGLFSTIEDNAAYTQRFDVEIGPVFQRLAESHVVNSRFDLSLAGQTDVVTTEFRLLPLEIALPAGTDRWIEIPSVIGEWFAGPMWPVHGGEGGEVGPGPTLGTNILASNGISGIYARRFLFLAGAFLSDQEPETGTDPPRLDFEALGIEFSELSPVLQQSFFIGDGHTTDGIVQRFHVPDGATRLSLGVLDADRFGWPQGGLPPGAYGDNEGELDVDVEVYVAGLNDIPTLNSVGSVVLTEDSPVHEVNLTGISAGVNEIQPLRFTVTTDRPGLLSQLQVQYDGTSTTATLQMQPARNASGDATIEVVVEDAGLDHDFSTTGDNQTFTRTFTVTVTPSLDAVVLRERGTGRWHFGESSGTSFSKSSSLLWNPSVSWSTYDGDFDGDGSTDVAGRTSNGDWWVILNTSSGLSNSSWGTWGLDIANRWETIHVADFNGDGRDDIAGLDQNGTWRVGISDGSRFVSTDWGTQGPGNWFAFLSGDFNGDGRADIASLRGDGRWFVNESDGTAFSIDEYVRVAAPSLVDWRNFMVGDFNGDGVDDILMQHKLGHWWIGDGDTDLSSNDDRFKIHYGNRWNPVGFIDYKIADFNGDGRDDLAGRYNNYWWVNRSLANGRMFAQYWGRWGTTQQMQTTVGDFNGDGFDDIAGLLADNNTWWVQISNGTTFTNHFFGLWSLSGGASELHSLI
ncbi:MAG: VCBS repeat-containing protein [Planctomycetaceae bacterium]